MTKLETITAEDLQNRTYEPTHFLVDELIPEGLHILAGAPKIGKSWLALWLCLCVSQGQPLWNFATTQGEVLYLSLEDSFQRIQTRLFDLTEDAPSTLHFAIMADTLKHIRVVGHQRDGHESAEAPAVNANLVSIYVRKRLQILDRKSTRLNSSH